MIPINLRDILGKDTKKCTSQEIAAAREQLQAMLNYADVEQGRTERREARRLLNQKRAQYQLAKPMYRDQVDAVGVVKALNEKFESQDHIAIDEYNTIVHKHTHKVSNDFKDVYPCPECGAEGSLYVGRFDGGVRRVVCSRCDWECPRQARYNDWEAKDAFVLYLNKQGYLGEKKPKLEDVK